jgi:hypothetical protein
MSLQTNTKKPFCKVCQDTGKPESVYTSHWVRSLPDRSGNTTIVCPTLLSTECKYCFKIGHTIKFCSLIAKNNKEKERNERRAAFAEIQKNDKKPISSKKVSRFDALNNDSDSENEEEKVMYKVSPTTEKEEFPVLGNMKATREPIKTGWAAAVKTTDEEKDKQLEDLTLKRSLPPITKKIDVVIPTVNSRDKPIYTRSWADWTDSESEDDEEDEPVVFPEPKFNVNYISNASVAVSAADDDW